MELNDHISLSRHLDGYLLRQVPSDDAGSPDGHDAGEGDARSTRGQVTWFCSSLVEHPSES